MSGLLDKPANSAASLADDSPAVDLPSAGSPPSGRRWIRAILWWPVHLATLSVAGVALAGYCGRLGWLFELASHFRLQYGVLLAASSLCYLIGRRWRAGLAAGFLSAANLCLVVSVGSPPPKPEDRTVVRAVIYNVLASNRDYERLWEFVRAASPDLVVLVEVDFEWAASLHALDGAYPYRRVSPAPWGLGMALLSRIPLDDVEQTMIGGGDGTVIGGIDGTLIGGTDGTLIGGTGNALAMVARLRIDGQPLTLIGTHPCSPVSPGKFESRNQELADLARLAGRQRGPIILLADLNTSPWSPYFQDLLSASRLRDSRQGFGIQASWPTFLPIASIPIDHCLVSQEIAVHDRAIGPNLGSDHFPVIVDFSIWPQSGE
jgi:endonuclease/exonuclease/phosphatase (EEP) superfamily protein YafD